MRKFFYVFLLSVLTCAVWAQSAINSEATVTDRIKAWSFGNGVVIGAVNSSYEISAISGQAVGEMANAQYIIHSGIWSQYPVITGLEDDLLAQLPKVYQLRQNYPNPFNPQTTIEYALPFPGRVSIEVFNIIGQKVAELIDAQKPAGYYKLIWSGGGSNGHFVANGVYFYRMVARANQGNTFVKTRKMLFLK